jgi:hypothetical protein
MMTWECSRAQVRRRRIQSTGERLLGGARIPRTRPNLGSSKLPCWKLLKRRGYLLSRGGQLVFLPSDALPLPPPSVPVTDYHSSISLCFAISRFIGPVSAFDILGHCRALSLLSCTYTLTSLSRLQLSYLFDICFLHNLYFLWSYFISHWLSSMFLLVFLFMIMLYCSFLETKISYDVREQ